MSRESFNPNYPSRKEIKEAEAHLTDSQRESSRRGRIQFPESREESLAKLKSVGRECKLNDIEIEEAIRTFRWEGARVTFTLRRKVVVIDNHEYVTVNSRELDKFGQTQEFFHKYLRFVKELEALSREQGATIWKNTPPEKQAQIKSEREINRDALREDLKNLGIET